MLRGVPPGSGSRKKSPTRMFVIFALSWAIALVTGSGWIGRPLRWVWVLTLVGVGMSAGVAWAQAIATLRAARAQRSEETATESPE
jgi:hypothetical protein